VAVGHLVDRQLVIAGFQRLDDRKVQRAAMSTVDMPEVFATDLFSNTRAEALGRRGWPRRPVGAQRRSGSVTTAAEGMSGMVIHNWCDAPQIHPSEIRVGDVIGTMKATNLRYTVKLIGGPQTSPRRWTFFSRDDNGMQHTSTFGEDDLVRRYAKG
jgi:hypothetical protein